MDLNDRNFLFYLSLAATLLVSRIPSAGKFLRVAHTLVHESGHALVTLLTSGQVVRIELFSNTEGKAVSKSPNAFARFLVALAGYPAASATALLFFFWISNGREQMVIYSMIILALVNLTLFVRNAYGLFWLCGITALLGYIIYLDDHLASNIAAVVLASAILFDAVLYPIYLTWISISDAPGAGDAALLREITGVPSWFWALLFTAQAAWLGWLTICHFPLSV